MALLAETLVEEWLNRGQFFTIRGVRQGVDEIDLLAARYREAQQPEAWHVESQVSFRPIGYITPLARELARELGEEEHLGLSTHRSAVGAVRRVNEKWKE